MLTFFVIVPVLIAVFLFVFSTNKAARVLAIIIQSLFVLATFWLFLQSRHTEFITYVGSYDDVLGIILRTSNTSAVFILLTSVIFLAVSIYSYNEEGVRTFWFLLFILEAVLVGLFLTRDLFNIFVLVEVGTVVVTILIMYYRGRRQMFTGMVYLMLNIVAMQFYLFGIGYIYMLTGAFDVAHVADALAYIDREALVLPYALIMTGMAFKCAIIPLHSFVPKVRLYPAAPSAVVAILSGVQIKTNVYLFLQFHQVFDTFSAQGFFLAVGIITSAIGVFMAMCQTDIKMILAYHTVSQVGLIIIGLFAGTEYSFLGGLFHVISHGVFKTALFLTAGIIFHAYGTRDVYKIRGVMRRMPIVGAVTVAAVLGITGAPFFIGSISKYFISADVHWLVEWSVIIISLGTIISFTKYAGMLFGKPDQDLIGDKPKPDTWRLVPAMALGAMCLLGGVFGQPLVNFLFVNTATIDIMGYAQKALIFFVSVAVGYGIYKYIIAGNKLLKRIGDLDLGFKSACASMGAFFGLIIIMVGVL
ncbi:MAG: proton-conducting membrane transporter [Defluviitaleaceae bacterium]|nr:proton-conducting membrane transporter [Defluviitaleaceae bacterium]